MARKPWSVELPCTTTSSLVYSFGDDHVLLGSELLALHGLPLADLNVHEIPLPKLADLAGESMFAASVGSLVYSVFLIEHAAWWRRPTS